MLRYIAGILTALLFIGSVFGLLYIFDQYDYIDLKPSVLISLSTIPGWEEVADAYKLGLENKNFLEERQQELAEREKEMEAEKQTLAELALALQEKEDYLEIERRKTLNELSRVGNNQAPAVNEREKYATAARLLESMSPTVAGENLLKMPFEMGVSVLSLLDPRKAGKILESIPPEKSSRYMEKMSAR